MKKYKYYGSTHDNNSSEDKNTEPNKLLISNKGIILNGVKLNHVHKYSVDIEEKDGELTSLATVTFTVAEVLSDLMNAERIDCEFSKNFD